MQKTVSILLALLLLIGNAQLTFGQHFCGGEVMDTAMMIGERHMNCGPVDQGCENEGEKTEVADCCTSIYHQVETDTDYAGSYFHLDFNTDFIVAEVFDFSFKQIVLYSSKSVSFSEYLPPPLLKDIPVLYQTFLI